MRIHGSAHLVAMAETAPPTLCFESTMVFPFESLFLWVPSPSPFQTTLFAPLPDSHLQSPRRPPAARSFGRHPPGNPPTPFEIRRSPQESGKSIPTAPVLLWRESTRGYIGAASAVICGDTPVWLPAFAL